jgi:hypothetical protein
MAHTAKTAPSLIEAEVSRQVLKTRIIFRRIICNKVSNLILSDCKLRKDRLYPFCNPNTGVAGRLLG